MVDETDEDSIVGGEWLECSQCEGTGCGTTLGAGVHRPCSSCGGAQFVFVELRASGALEFFTFEEIWSSSGKNPPQWAARILAESHGR